MYRGIVLNQDLTSYRCHLEDQPLLGEKRHSFSFVGKLGTRISSYLRIDFSWRTASILGHPICCAYGTNRQDFFLNHFPLSTEGTNSGINTRKPSQQILPSFSGRSLRLSVSRNAQKLPALLKFDFAASIAQKAIMTDLHKPIR